MLSANELTVYTLDKHFSDIDGITVVTIIKIPTSPQSAGYQIFRQKTFHSIH